MRWTRLLLQHVALCAAIGCGGKQLDRAESHSCVKDSDCPGDQTCKPLGKAAPLLPSPPAPSLPPPPPSCSSSSRCLTDAECGAGAYCRAATGGCPSACFADCAAPNANPCAVGFVCRSLYCQPLTCSDLEYPGCPTGMTCGLPRDEASIPPAGLFGSDQGDTTSDKQSKALEQGCVFLRCDQSGGFECAAGFRCDPPNAPPGTIGCAAIPCTEGAACRTDSYVCESTSAGPHLGMDVHGCVARNCDEGYVCPASSTCDFTKAGDSRGCAYLRCDEPGGSCAAGKKCHPEPLTLPSGVTSPPDGYGCIFASGIDGAAHGGSGGSEQVGTGGTTGAATAGAPAGAEPVGVCG